MEYTSVQIRTTITLPYSLLNLDHQAILHQGKKVLFGMETISETLHSVPFWGLKLSLFEGEKKAKMHASLKYFLDIQICNWFPFMRRAWADLQGITQVIRKGCVYKWQSAQGWCRGRLAVTGRLNQSVSISRRWVWDHGDLFLSVPPWPL